MSSKSLSDGSLYDQVAAMLQVSNLIYAFSTINCDRKDIKDEDIKEPAFLEHLPKTSSEMSSWLNANSAVFQKAISKLARQEEQQDFDLGIMESILARDKMDAMTLEVLSDRFGFSGKDSEIVYGITKNPQQKRLTLVFRGSIVRKDWYQNAKVKDEKLVSDALHQTVSNPNREALEGFDSVSIHRGFFEYLFVETSKDDNRTKFGQISEEIVRRLNDPSCEGYSLYVTGHSLGAALATLAAAAFALSDDVKEPVKLITFASPHVGKEDFVKAFAILEQKGLLRHLRVTNNNDLTPQGLGVLGYRHTGIHLNLLQPSVQTLVRGKSYRLSPSSTEGTAVWTNQMAVSLSWINPGDKHRLKVHQIRLERNKEYLEKEPSVDGLYDDPSLRGW